MSLDRSHPMFPDESPDDRAAAYPMTGIDAASLYESATLAALGLLEEDEQHAFDVALSAAPDSVRGAIELEMARVVDLRPLLPDVEPAPELRAKVLARVREAIAAERHEPHDAMRTFSIQSPTRVSPLWRGAALGLLAACLALGAVFVQLAGDAERVDTERLMAEVQDEIGARFVVDTLFSSSTQRRVFGASGESVGDAQVALWFNPEWDHARLYHRNLPVGEGRTFVLAEVDANQKIVRDVVSFQGSGVLTSVRAPLVLIDGEPPMLALFMTDGSGARVLVMTMSAGSLS